jgi:glycosyltransferase involved in cell wall biosynthesis
MKISIVIPTYNRKEYLSKGLYYLSVQERVPNVEVEVIVVDDGSTDSTSIVVEDFKEKMNDLLYIYRPRDEFSNLSRTRNLGIEKSSGDLIIFLDSGILVPPDFIRNVADHYKNQLPNKKVLIPYMVGLFVDPEKDNTTVLNQVTPGTLSEISEHLLLTDAVWLDHREGLFNLVNDNLDQLAAPWTLGWGCAIAAPRKLVLEVEGFDESFNGWGSEDTDFAYRLYRQGASFTAVRDAFGFHLPHPTSSSKEKQLTNIDNRKKLHRKFYQLDTELYSFYPGPYYNKVLGGLNQLVITNITPRILSSQLLNEINNSFLPKSKNSLLLGTDCVTTANNLNVTHIFTHNKSTLINFKKHFKNTTIEYLLGCDTPYSNKYFDVIIVTDFVRLLGPVVQKELFRELNRISKKILVIYTHNYISSAKKIDGHPWSNINEIKEMARSVQLTTKNELNIDNHILIAMQGS